jgi:hypothetical protein
MRYLFRLALRNLWIRKTRTVLITLGIVLLGPKLAALWPAEVAARTDMITALKEERGG